MMQDALVHGMREEEKNGRKSEEPNESYKGLGIIWRRTAKRGLQRVSSLQRHNGLDLQ